MLRYAFVILCLGLAPALTPVAAKAELMDYGIGVGETIPNDLTSVDQLGQVQNFETLQSEKGLVLVFVRSADWCPYCQAQLIDLGQRGHEIEATGYNLVGISYDSTDKLMDFTKKYDFQYTLLSDPDSEIIKDFGVLNTTLDQDSDYYGTPFPGIFIIGSNGVVQGKLFEEDYKNRPPVEQIVATIKGIDLPQ